MAVPLVARLLLGAARGGITAAQVPKVDIGLFGDRALQRKLNRLTTPRAKAVVRKALRKSAKRAQKRVVANLSGAPVNVRSGELRAAFKAAPIKSQGKRGLIRLGPVLPTREALGIGKDDAHYYPFAVEYGHAGAPAYPFVRPAVDDHRDSEFREIGRDIGKGIEAEARR